MTTALAAWLRKLKDKGPQKATYTDDLPLRSAQLGIFGHWG